MTEKRLISFGKLRENCAYLITPWGGGRSTRCDHDKNMRDWDEGLCRSSRCPIWKRLKKVPSDD